MMTVNNSWLLPQGIEEALPADAARLESLRRKLLDVYASWGYKLVMPPFIEYLESLLTGTGHDLDLQTFKITDQLTGRTMGVRADMTPQVARIDAHQSKQDGPNRLCYMGTVLNTRSDGFGSSRSPLQVGAELYGHVGVESDVEIISLMLETFKQTGVDNVFVDIGHVGIFRGLSKQAQFDEEQEASLFEMLQRKAIPEIEQFLQQQSIPAEVRTMLSSLAELHGGDECLEKAAESFSQADESVQQALSYLQKTVSKLKQRIPQVNIHFDLSELRGYHYQTGIVFAAYVAGQGQEIARGGRYDDIGKVFGRARPATGFSTDLKTLINLSSLDFADINNQAIMAPCEDDAALFDVIAALRAEGKTVIEALPGQAVDAKELGCTQQLINKNGQWKISE